MSDTVIGLGVNKLEDFSAFGQEVAEEVASAATVIVLRDNNAARDLKSGNDVSVYIFDDVDTALFGCCDRIKNAWEVSRPEEAHLSHAAAGMWMYYWMGKGLVSIRNLVVSGRIDELRASATDYIESDFGANRGPTL